MSKHAQPASGWRRRILGLPVVVWLLFALAGVAFAAWIVTKTTTSSTFQTQGAGTLNIGDASTVKLFDLPTLSPGDSQTACLQAEWTSPPAGPVLRLFAGASTPADTGLQDYLTVTIHGGTMTGNGVGIVAGCTGFTPGASPLFTGTLAAYKASRLAYATGDTLTLRNGGGGFHYAAVRITVALPDTPTVQANAGGKSAAIAWTLEGRSS